MHLKRIVYTKINLYSKVQLCNSQVIKNEFPLSTYFLEMSFTSHTMLDLPITNHSGCTVIQTFVRNWLTTSTLHFCELLSLLISRAPGFLYFTVIGVYKSSHPLWTVRMLHPLGLCFPNAPRCGAIARCGNGRCEGLSWFLSSSLLSSFSSPPPSGSSGRPQQCEAPKGDEKGRERERFKSRPCER